jgi:hypothetical protein
VEKPEGRRLLGRTRVRWVDSIKIDREEMVRAIMDRIDLSEDRGKFRLLVEAATNDRVP